MSQVDQKPSIDDQRNTIKQLISKSELVCGDYAYAISLSWFGAWKELVGFDGEDPNVIEIGPIDNKPLEKDNNFDFHKKEGIDFQILTQPVWSTLYSWYGGGPIFIFPIEYDHFTKSNIAVIYKTTIITRFQDKIKTFKISPYISVI